MRVPLFPMYRIASFLIFLLAGVSGLPAQSDSPEQILQEAVQHHQAGDIDGAIRGYERYLALQPDSTIALSNLGAAYAHAGRYEDAIAQYSRALKVQPGNVQIEMNLGLAYYKSGQASQAAAILKTVHDAAPDQEQTTLLLSDCWLSLGKNKDVAGLLTPLAEKKPDDLALAYLLGTALVRDNQVDKGQVLIDRILRNGDSAEARMLMGTTKLQVMDFAGARADLAKAVELNPALPDVYSFYGQALISTGDEQGALKAFRKELENNPNDFNANLQLAAILRRDESLDEAIKYLNRALQVRPGDLAVRYQLAAVEFTKGHLDDAVRELEAIVKEAPQFREAHVTLATAYYRMKRKEDGDRERAVVQTLTAEAQAKEPGAQVK